MTSIKFGDTFGRMTTDDALALANQWAATGVPAFPVGISRDEENDKLGKRPLCDNGFNDASTDAPVLAVLFRVGESRLAEGEVIGVGVWPGPAGIAVLDVDVKRRANGPQTLAALEAEHGELPTTYRVDTPSHGYHLWFRKGDGSHLGNRKLSTGIDIRADAGYVVAPGTRTPWGSWVAGEHREFAPLPKWVPEVQARSNGRTSGAGVDAVLDGPPILEGERDNTLTSIAGYWRRMGLSERGILGVLWDVNETRVKPPLPPEDLERIAASVARYEPGEPLPDWSPAPTSSARRPGVTSTQERLVPGGSWALNEPETIPAVWGERDRVLWSEGEGFMLNGHQGTGKTTLGQQLVLHRIGVREGDLLGLPVARDDRPVLYLAMDRPRQAARSFRRMIGSEHRDLVDQRLKVWLGPLPFVLPGEPGRLAEWVLDQVPGCGTLVVDSAKDLAAGVSKDDVGAACNMAFQGVIAEGVELLLLHHGRKATSGAERELTLDAVYGSTWLTSGLGSVVLIEGNPGDRVVTLHHAKQPAEVVGPLTVSHDHRGGVTTLAELVTGSALDLLRAAGDAGVTKRDAALALYGGTEDRRQKRAERELNRLVDGGLATKIAGRKLSGRGQEPGRWVVTPEGASSPGAPVPEQSEI